MSSPAPDYRITIAGEQDITPKLRPFLISLTLTDCKGLEADQLDLELNDIGAVLAMPKTGVTLDVAIGWQGEELVDKGQFKVDEVSHDGPPDRIIIRARSADLGLNFRAKVEQSWHATTLGNIVTTIALRNNLEPRIDSRISQRTVDHIDQTESDAEFITRLAGRYDCIGTVKRNRLIFVPCNFIMAERKAKAKTEKGGYTGVRAYWIKPGKKTRKRVVVGDSTKRVYRLQDPIHSTEDAAKAAATAKWQTLSRQQTTARNEARPLDPDGKSTAAAVAVPAQDETDLTTLVVARSDGDQHSYNNSDRNAYSGVRAYYHDPRRASRRGVLVGLAGNAKHLRETFANEDDALQAAQAEWQRIERGVATLNLTLARGRPDAVAACPVAVSGYRAEIDATEWQAARVVSTITGSGGFTTRIECEVIGSITSADGDASAPQDAEDIPDDNASAEAVDN